MSSSTISWSSLTTRGKEGSKPRHGHSACVIGGRLHVFGGRGEGGAGYLDDTIVLDPSSLTWKATRTRSRPPARAYHTANAFADNRMVVFGGAAAPAEESEGEVPTYLNDVWLYKVDGSAWERCSVNGQPPCGRAAHSAVLLSGGTRATLVVFGGTDGSSTTSGSGGGGRARMAALNDLWLLSITSPKWELVQTSGTPCQPRTAKPRTACTLTYLFSPSLPSHTHRPDTLAAVLSHVLAERRQ